MNHYNHCLICNGNKNRLFNTLILNKYNVDYFQCEYCEMIQTEKPYWLKEAYQEPINISDTGLIARNLRLRKLVFCLIQLYFSKSNLWIDVGGGYGMFTRLMRDLGVNYYWEDPYTNNLFAKGFEATQLKKKDPVNLSAFEVFEHVVDVRSFLNQYRKQFDIKTVIFSTWLLPKKVPKQDWWYYGFEHGQHISFYSEKSLRILANTLNYNYTKVLDHLHIFSEKKINPFKLWLIQSKLKHLLFFYLNLKASSLTEQDSQILKEIN